MVALRERLPQHQSLMKPFKAFTAATLAAASLVAAPVNASLSDSFNNVQKQEAKWEKECRDGYANAPFKGSMRGVDVVNGRVVKYSIKQYVTWKDCATTHGRFGGIHTYQDKDLGTVTYEYKIEGDNMFYYWRYVSKGKPTKVFREYVGCRRKANGYC